MIKVGTKVKIIDKDARYESYISWFDFYCPELKERYLITKQDSLRNGQAAVVICENYWSMAKRKACKDIVYVIERKDRSIFLIAKEGISEVQ